MRPRIGINCDVKPNARRRGDGRLLALNPDYVRAVLDAGGTPVLLPPYSVEGRVDHAALDDALGALDGVILSGGDDMDPAAYSQPPHARLQQMDRDRDRSDLALARAALRRGLPVLGVCGGMQLLNVVLGGTLHQHLDDARARAYPGLLPIHVDPDAGADLHDVRVVAGSRLARVLGLEAGGTVRTNSRHHQAVDHLGAGLVASARAEDGVIEAIESERGDPVLAVQWHPEEHVGDALHARIVLDLIQSCSRRTGGRAHRSTLAMDASGARLSSDAAGAPGADASSDSPGAARTVHSMDVPSTARTKDPTSP